MNSKIIDRIFLLTIILILCIYFLIRNIAYQDISFIDQINNTERFIKEEKWNEAVKSSYELKSKWDSVIFLVYVNYAEADISYMEDHVMNLISGVENQDKVTSLNSTLQVKELWNNINKFVPQH